jgi:hypothetical protein
MFNKLTSYIFILCLPFQFICSFAFSNQLEPSETSCQFYTDLQNAKLCPDTKYINQAEKLCKMYLRDQPYLGNEIQSFFPGVRKCLQEQLLLNLNNPSFCQNLEGFAIDSHIICYEENNYCDLSFLSKIKLGWLVKFNILHKTWFKTAQEINRTCSKN